MEASWFIITLLTRMKRERDAGFQNNKRLIKIKLLCMHTKQFFFYKIVVNGLFDHRLNNLRRFFGRNFDAESGAFGDLAFKRNLPSEIIHDHFNDKKSESGAAFFGVIRV